MQVLFNLPHRKDGGGDLVSMGDDERRQKMRLMGPISQAFQWEYAAKQTLDVYKKIKFSLKYKR